MDALKWIIQLKCVFLAVFMTCQPGSSFPFGGLSVPDSNPRKAMCYMTPDPNSELHVRGLVTLEQSSDIDVLNITVDVMGLNCQQRGTPKEDFRHGFHVHEYGTIHGGCGSAGGHYNPKGASHGAPLADERHIGDLGNLVQESDGTISTNFVDNVASLYGEYSIIGRALVLHASEDDLGLGGNPGSVASGNAGPRLACCIIGVAKVDD